MTVAPTPAKTTSLTQPDSSPAAWGLYLGVSWTWCIGMFLPVLLLRDFGLSSFAVFAIPNVLGAAAMGFVLKPGISERIVADHAFFCRFFSWITIAYHLFFACWIPGLLLGLPVLAPILLLVLVCLQYWFQRSSSVRAGALTYLLSLACIAFFLLRFSPALPDPGLRLAGSNHLLAGLAAVCLFGFVFCPYLDLTFHRARQSTSDNGARIAFTLGFAVFFFSMILFTLGYSGHLIFLLLHHPVAPLLAVLLCIHLLIQSSFTIAAHVHELRCVSGGAYRRSAMLKFLILFLLLIPGSLLILHLHPAAAEPLYLLFLSCYGLIFPAYVYLNLLPHSQRNIPLLIICVLLAAPLYYLAFFHHRMNLLLPAVALILLLRIAGQRIPLGGKSSILMDHD